MRVLALLPGRGAEVIKYSAERCGFLVYQLLFLFLKNNMENCQPLGGAPCLAWSWRLMEARRVSLENGRGELPRWLGGEESACQRSGNTPRATGSWATCHSYRTCALEPGDGVYWARVLTSPEAWEPQSWFSATRGALTPQLERSPCSPQLEKILHSKEDPAHSELINKIINKNKLAVEISRWEAREYVFWDAGEERWRRESGIRMRLQRLGGHPTWYSRGNPLALMRTHRSE